MFIIKNYFIKDRPMDRTYIKFSNNTIWMQPDPYLLMTD